MAPSTARYQISGFFYAALQDDNTTIRTTELFYPNKIEPEANPVDIVFEGGDQRRHVYMTTEYTLTLDQDCLDLNAASIVFGKNKTTDGLSLTPFSTEYTWMGEAAEGAGASVGFVGKAHAIKNVGGVETAVDIVLWIPVATLTLARHQGLTTAAKGTFPQYKLSATRSSVNIIGETLSGVPTGGAFYAIGE